MRQRRPSVARRGCDSIASIRAPDYRPPRAGRRSTRPTRTAQSRAATVISAFLAAVMFFLAFGRRSRKPATAVVDWRPAVSSPPPPPLPPQPISVALSAALPPLPASASLFDVLTHRFSTRVVGASDEAIDAAVHVMRTGSKSALFGTLAVVVLFGVMLGRPHR